MTSAPTFATAITDALARLPGGGSEWVTAGLEAPNGKWLSVRHEAAPVPEQGWKLHVSAGLPCADETLGRVLPVLLREPVAFKVASSLAALATLNDGAGSLSQVGKFVTVYPCDDPQAVRLAEALVEATHGLRGPAVPTDRPIRPRSVVHYRYGSFGRRTVQSLNGEVAFAVLGPHGELEPDVRGTSYQPPPWALDPFSAAGLAVDEPVPSPVVADRFLVVGILHRSARGSVCLAVDLDGPQICVLKSAEAGALMGPGGRDARDQLRHESAVLKRLAPDERFPAVLALVEQGDALYLAMEDFRATTLESAVLAHSALGRTVAHAQVLAWGRELADMLQTIHAAGLVYRDLKSTNVLVTEGGHLHLVDFEQACTPGSRDPSGGRGTRGYMSPQQVSGEPAESSDDVYGLGMLLAYMATGAEPSQAPRPEAPLGRPLELLNPTISPALASLVERCVATNPAERFASAASVAIALEAIASRGDFVAGVRTPDTPVDEAVARRSAEDLSRRTADAMCQAAVAVPGSPAMVWTSSHPLGLGIPGRDVNTGGAGTVLALAEIVGALRVPRHIEVLAGAVHWLRDAVRSGVQPLPGLYVGEAGVVAALLRAGQVLGDEKLVALAVTRSRAVATLPHASPDLFNGSAGRLLAHLLFWDETGEPEDLRHAIAAGDHLLTTMEATSDGGGRWLIPEGYSGISAKAYLGYAHGAAGIADALLELFEATQDDRWLEGARRAARWLANLAQPVLDDDRGLGWPTVEGEQPAAAYWCHGSAGVGRFWLHAARLDLVPDARTFVAGAVASTAYGARWSMPPQCHGLSGSIELLLDAYQESGDAVRLREARNLAALLQAFAIEVEGGLAWPSESPLVVTPDFNVGYAGVATTWLRLADPERRPHCLSRRAFRAGTP